MELQLTNSLRRAALAGLLATVASLAAGPPSRIQADIQNRQTFRLAGNIHPLAGSAQDQGEVPDWLVLPRIAIHFKMTAAQQADLDALIEAQQNPSSPQFHQWLTPEQYADRFGISTGDLSRITAWLERMGFTDIQAARGRTFVTMSGVAAVARYAFQTPIHHYLADGSLHYANAAEPALPIELQGMVAGIRGMDDFRPRPHSQPQPRFTSSLSGSHFLAPGDFATIYNLQPLYNAGIDGTGQSIVIAGQTDIQISDISAFQTASGLPVKAPQIILTGSDPGTSSGDVMEADLDVEWSGAVARGATIIYVNSTNVFNSVTYAIDSNLGSIVSITYGLCEAQISPSQLSSLDSLFQQANAQGITVLAAAGDTGAADCETASAPTIATHGLGVDFPGSSPHVTSVGGTEFNEGAATYWSSTNGLNSGSALSYIPEIVWNDTATDGVLSATGGGVSVVFAKPSWQQGSGVPNDAHRDVPDVALSASVDHDAYLMCDSGWCTNGYRNSATYLDVVGGTSAGTPTFAGIVALIDQHANSRQGNINPTLYSLAAQSSGVFHDITTGNNIVPCRIGTPNCTTGSMGYSAGPGYDQTTGLGSVNAYNLLTAWPASGGIAPPAPVLTSPANRATGLTLSQSLVWQAATGATSYNVYFGTSSPPPLVAAQTTGTTYNPGALSGGATYYWSVTALNAYGSAGSAVWSFSTAGSPPAAPSLTSPANGATGVAATPTLIWQASTGATSYNVYFGSVYPPALATQTGATAYSPGTLSAGVTYYWSVTALNASGSAASAIWSFTTAPPVETPPGVPILVVPVNGATGVTASPTLGWLAAAGATSYNVYFGTASPPPLVTQTAGTTYVPGTLIPGVPYYWSITAVNAYGSAPSATWSFTPGYSGALLFVPVTPCRVADTRNAAGPFGGATLTPGSTRDFAVSESACGIPTTAAAYSLNVTVVPQGPLSYLTLWPTGQPQPVTSTLNSLGGIVVANAAIVPAGVNGEVSVFVTGTTDVILDIDGYFTNAAGGLSFYTATPCRIADTRGPDGTFGGPSLAAGQSRDFPILSSGCGIPSSASAYSMNVTAVPSEPLAFLQAWPSGQAQPNVSTLNSPTGLVVANAAIVPAGAGGAITVYTTDPTDLVLDANGYFAAPGNPGALSFYAVTPCRIADTRTAAGPFGGPALAGGATRSFNIPASACSIPATAQAYSLNITVVPDGPLAFLTAWATGSSAPVASTLNSWDGDIAANAAIVPAGAGGAISIFVPDPTDLVLDINGYFAP